MSRGLVEEVAYEELHSNDLRHFSLRLHNEKPQTCFLCVVLSVQGQSKPPLLRVSNIEKRERAPILRRL